MTDIAARLLRRARSGFLALLLIAPAVVWLVGGPVAPFEARRQAPPPTALAAVGPDPAGREQLSDALLERSAVKREAIRLRNRVLWRVFGFADTDVVVSGAAGWLFYKPQFERWACERAERLDQGFERLLLLADLAAAAEIDFTAVIAPNKASVQPNAMGGRAALYTECYYERERVLRALAEAAPQGRIIDHARLFNFWTGDREPYRRLDSHWEPDAGTLGLNQLIAEAPFEIGAPAPTEPLTEVQEEADLANRLLLFTEPERVFYTPLETRSRPAGGPRRVTFLHDSFYARISDQADTFLPASSRLDLRYATPDQVQAELSDADAVIYQRVERHLADTLLDRRRFDWGSPFGDWMFAQVETRAQQRCDWSRALDLMSPQNAPRIRKMGMTIAPGGFATSDAGNPRLHISPPEAWRGAPICLRVRIETEEPESTWLFFSGAFLREGYTGGRSIRWPTTRGETTLIMPDRDPSRPFRFDPVRNARSFRFERLEIAPISAAD